LLRNRTTLICFISLLCLILFTSCEQTSPPAAVPTKTVSAGRDKSGPYTPTPVMTPTLTMSGTPDTTPTHYTSHVILSRVGRPDDLVFDPQGHLVFSDYYNGTVSRVNANGSVTVLASGIAGPEGIVFLSDGTMIIAEQRTNRILSLAPGARSPTVLRTLPGTPGGPPCKDGVDGIALDPITKTLIVSDSPTGDVYRMSLDGQTLTLLASGIPRPVGAAVDAYGTVYIADECGGSLWTIATNGKTTRMRGFGKLDDVVFDSHGNILVIDLLPSIHALIRIRRSTGRRETLASRGFIEPQGLAVDKNDDIFVADDYANIIVEYKPA
jgi:DNA-binding beta-propeller fold protein YncE